MARKGNQRKNGLDRHSSNNKKGVLDSGSASPNTKESGKVSQSKVVSNDELPNVNQPGIPLMESMNSFNHLEDDKKSKQKHGKFKRKHKQNMDATQSLDQQVPFSSDSGDCTQVASEASGSGEENGMPPNSNDHPKKSKTSFGHFLNELNREDNMMENMLFSDAVVVRRLRTLVLSIVKISTEWLERQKPFFVILTTNLLNARDYVREKIEHVYPIVLRWTLHFGNILFLLSMVWLDCALRGIESLLRMGTTSYFAVIWCCILSIIAMIGIFKFLLILVVAALVGFLLGFTVAILLIAISGIVLLWFYGSFWTTALLILFGGLAFSLNHERVALFITTVYSVYCAWTYVGWLGLLLGLNLSFISSDALVFFLKNNINEHTRPNGPSEHTARMRAEQGYFSGDSMHASFSETGSGPPADRSPGVPSTSGSDSEISSEDEVLRLLNCRDHYSALGLSRFENVDVSHLKREYRKKAMLVHPDKNMGNEKAAEAFKKLQNAYEVLFDSFKRKEYDDELRREELLNCFRRFQNTNQKNEQHGLFAYGFGHGEAEGEDPLEESRRIACRKCNGFHIWLHTKRSKSRARWCQDCKDFHQAKDGDGWVEQSSQPFFFGILQKVDAPCAYICAGSKIYDATEWYICQGMRCPFNTHKPSFHVNTSLTSKHSNGRGTSSGQKSGAMPTSNMEETMTEEEFFEWLQNAMQTGMFDDFAGSTSQSPFGHAGNSSRSGGGNGGGGSSGSKRKKKGKKQW